jgi:hypothetical protein
MDGADLPGDREAGRRETPQWRAGTAAHSVTEGNVIQKPIDQLTKADIDTLVADQVGELRTLEYKRQKPGEREKDRKEYLADVSSFANAAGGYLLYGVAEKLDADGKNTGLPESAPGLAGVNADAEILRLESMIRTGIQPRIPVITRPITGFSDGPVLAMWIPRSFQAPHMVTFQDHSRFYSRSSAGKYVMDVGQIRSAFALAASLPDRVRRFREERLGRIIAEETPVKIKIGPTVVLHVVPVSSLEPAASVDLTAAAGPNSLLIPMSSTSLSSITKRFNIDGLLACAIREKTCRSYVQLFRTGAVEAVETLQVKDGEKAFRAPAVAKSLWGALSNYKGLLHFAGVVPPMFVLVSLLGVTGYYIPDQVDDPEAEFDRDAVLLPDVLLEDDATHPAQVLRPAFDAMWQASGWPRCPHFNDKNEWVGR